MIKCFSFNQQAIQAGPIYAYILHIYDHMIMLTIFFFTSKLYKLGGELGKGGFGVVYAAVRKADKLQVNLSGKLTSFR